MRVTDFDYDLPEELIAQVPVEPRDAARLMVLSRTDGSVSHRVFRDLPELLAPGDCLVVNDSRVIPARLWGSRQPSGGKVELLLLRRISHRQWEVLARPGRRLKPGAEVSFGEGRLTAVVETETNAGGKTVSFQWAGPSFEAVLDELGQMPLPPYIHAELADPERYQTVYNRELGSAAAPTAGLHFTEQLLDRLAEMGVHIARVTLHVGLGTFRPVQVEAVEEHEMHSEAFSIGAEAVETINGVKRAGGRIIAVGTTATRTLETQADEAGYLHPGSGETDIFIYPGYQFRAIDGLITNFHLPKSTLTMLVSAFVGRERVMAAYGEAVRQKYRFFSFGDAMLII